MSARTGDDPGSASEPALDFLRPPRVRQSLARAAARIDAGLLVAVALGLFAAIPFLTRAALPHQTDAELHVYRTAQLHHLIRQGVLYPRWAADLYLGYGYPIFNYYAPLTYYLGSLLAVVVFGGSVVAGTKAVFVLGLVLASVGAYLLGRELLDPAGGILAAASFVLSPYLVFIDPHARGALAEHFAICLLPLAFVFAHRLLQSPTRGALLRTVVSVAAVVFSHNLMGLVASALLLAYWAWTLLVCGRRLHALWTVGAFAMAAGLVAFFWLPALLEYDAVKLDVIGPGHFDFRQHFLDLRELLAPSRLVDWGATGPRFRHNLGLARWVLALPAAAVVVGWLRRPPKEKHSCTRAAVGRESYLNQASADMEIRSTSLPGKGVGSAVAFFVLGALGLIFLMLPASTRVWELVPGMAYLQFPWRLLGATNLMLAVCATSVVTFLPEGVRARAVGAGSLALLLAMALPLLYPAPWDEDFGGTSPIDIIRWERASQALGTTSTGDFLPTSVDMIPSPAASLLRSYEQPGPVDKVNRATLPEGAEVTIVSHGPTHDRFHVTSPDDFVLRLYTFHFPGWRAYVDGQQVAIEVARPEGFITVPVPPGEHTVLIRFEDTVARRAGWVISAATLVILTALLAFWPGVHKRAEPATSHLGRRDGLWLGGTLAVILLLKLAVVDPAGILRLNSAPNQPLPAQHQVEVGFEETIELVGYDLPRTRVQPGESFPVVLYWHALRPIEENYQSFVHMAEPLDRVWAQEDHLNPGGLPTKRWPQDAYVWDEYEIHVLPGTPTGEYKINVGLYLSAEGYRLKRYDRGGEPVGNGFVIGSVRIFE